jgi:tRNA modification GTPase
MAHSRDTIFALSSGHGTAAIAVIRISGERAGDALRILTGRIPAPRQAALATIRSAQGEPIDQALGLFFPAPNSETGEDVAELQVHGGRAVVAAVLARLGELDGLRLAEAGEFTRRAFENGKLDLTQVEGLADLVGAETEAQRRQAFRHMTGLLGGRAEIWREQLLKALALVEARIDFSDEADVPEDLIGPALRIVHDIETDIAAALAQGRRGERLRDGFVVAIAGPPNAGKSTLLNRIARREAAIVSPYAGTTRDVIEVHLDLDGYPVTLLDTAGIRPTDDPVEQEGVRRAQQRASAADLVLWVTEASAAEETTWADALAGDDDTPSAAMELANCSIWQVRNKIDLVTGSNEPDAAERSELGKRGLAANASQPEGSQRNEPDLGTSVENSLTIPGKELLRSSGSRRNEFVFSNNDNRFNSSSERFPVSATSGAGVEQLIDALGAQAAAALGGGAEPALIARERHRAALQATREALQRASAIGESGREDVLAEELRLAATSLARLTGRIDVEDVLDAIFRDFCVGK